MSSPLGHGSYLLNDKLYPLFSHCQLVVAPIRSGEWTAGQGGGGGDTHFFRTAAPRQLSPKKADERGGGGGGEYSTASPESRANKLMNKGGGGADSDTFFRLKNFWLKFLDTD